MEVQKRMKADGVDDKIIENYPPQPVRYTTPRATAARWKGTHAHKSDRPRQFREHNFAKDKTLRDHLCGTRCPTLIHAAFNANGKRPRQRVARRLASMIEGSGLFSGELFAPLVPGVLEEPFLLRDYTGGLQALPPRSRTVTPLPPEAVPALGYDNAQPMHPSGSRFQFALRASDLAANGLPDGKKRLAILRCMLCCLVRHLCA